MDAYTNFARVYDAFMDNVPYEEWGVYVQKLLQNGGIADGLILDLGCGTGSFTEVMADKGYDMIGIDNAEDMLQIAIEKRAQSGADILYLLQDMREFELYGTVKAVIAVCDVMNYVITEEDLLQVFRLVNNYLDPGGLFLFDMNTIYKYEVILGDGTIAENRETCSFIWDNYYDREERLNEYELTIFLQKKEEYYQKFEEVHYQRAYSIETIKELLERAGLAFVAVYDAFTTEEPREDSERVYYIAKEKTK